MSWLQLENITMRFGGLMAIDNVSLTAKLASITAIIGPNGAGKTTLFNCLTGFYKPTSGKIFAGQVDISHLPSHLIARQARIVRSFQNIRLFKQLSVLENLLVAQQHLLPNNFAAWLARPSWQMQEQAAINRALALLEACHVAQYANRAAGSLPYGIQRRVEIARALAAEPFLLALDEPAAGLNAHESELLAQLLLNLKAQGLGIILIEHDMSVVNAVAEHVVVLDYGRKIAEGSVKTVMQNEAVIKAYLGEPA